MKSKSIWCQFKALLPTLFAVHILTLAVLCVFAILSLQTEIPISYFTRDPSAIMGAPFFIGLFSNVGILFWCSSAAICLFTFAVLRKDFDNRELPWFFLLSGLITSILLLDDLFLFQEQVCLKYLHIPEEVVLPGVDLVYLDPAFKSDQRYNVIFQEKDGTKSGAQIKAFEDIPQWNLTAEGICAEIVENGSDRRLAGLMTGMKQFLGTNDMMAYLVMMSIRLQELHRVLKPTGTIYLMKCLPKAA